jgi:redox-sensing transcriptional repressor
MPRSAPKKAQKPLPERTIGRLTLYRRILNQLKEEDLNHIHSHALAFQAGVSAAQVRRDLMVVGFEGSPQRGYGVEGLLTALGAFLDEPGGQSVALVGVGNIGRALLAYFVGRRPALSISAAFDVDPQKIGRVINACRCHPLSQLEQVIKAEGIRVAVLAVPASQAQTVAHRLVAAGVIGILNFAPVPLHTPGGVHVENLDVTMSLEKVAFFSRQGFRV